MQLIELFRVIGAVISLYLLAAGDYLISISFATLSLLMIENMSAKYYVMSALVAFFMSYILLAVFDCRFGFFEFERNAICLDAGYKPLPNNKKTTPVYIFLVAAFLSSILNVILRPFRIIAP